MRVYQEEPLANGRVYVVDAGTTYAEAEDGTVSDRDLQAEIYTRGPRGGKQYIVSVYSREGLEDEIAWHQRVLDDLREVRYEWDEERNG